MYYVSDVIRQIPPDVFVYSLYDHFDLFNVTEYDTEEIYDYLRDFIYKVLNTTPTVHNDVVLLCHKYQDYDKIYCDIKTYYSKDIYDCDLPTVIQEDLTSKEQLLRIRNLMPNEIIKSQLTISDVLGFTIDLLSAEQIGISYIESVFIYLHDLYKSENKINHLINDLRTKQTPPLWVSDSAPKTDEELYTLEYKGIRAELSALLEYKIKYSELKMREMVEKLVSSTEIKLLSSNYIFLSNSSFIEKFMKYFEFRFNLDEKWIIPVVSTIINIWEDSDYDIQNRLLNLFLKCREENLNLLRECAGFISKSN